MHFVSMLHTVLSSPFFLKEVDENYPKKIFPKTMEDNNCDVLEIRRKSNQLLPKLKLMVVTIEFMLLLLTECLNTAIEDIVDYVAKNKKFYLETEASAFFAASRRKSTKI